MTKVTKEDYQLFKAECKRWIDIWGLYGWDVTFRKAKLQEANATCWCDLEGRLCVITINREVDARNEIPIYSHHEIKELQLYPIREILDKRGVEHEFINNLFHEIINQEKMFLIKNGLLGKTAYEKEKTE
jgi:hypothetical protein